jgi:hypothetical protein
LPEWMPMPLKLSDPVSECRRRAADYGRRARTAIEIERFLEMELAEVFPDAEP